MSIFDLLKTSHNQQDEMMQKVLECEDVDERERLFRRFVVEVSYQQSAEERFLLIPLERAGFEILSGEVTGAPQAVFDSQVDEVLNLPNDDINWLPKVKALFESIKNRSRFEGEYCFDKLEKELSDSTKERLARDYMDFMDTKPEIMIYA